MICFTATTALEQAECANCQYAQGRGLGNGRSDGAGIDADAGSEAGKGFVVAGKPRMYIRSSGVCRVEIRRQVDEVGNRHVAVVVEITFLPGLVGRVEIRCQVDEVGNGDAAVEVQIADA